MLTIPGYPSLFFDINGVTLSDPSNVITPHIGSAQAVAAAENFDSSPHKVIGAVLAKVSLGHYAQNHILDGCLCWVVMVRYDSPLPDAGGQPPADVPGQTWPCCPTPDPSATPLDGAHMLLFFVDAVNGHGLGGIRGNS